MPNDTCPLRYPCWPRLEVLGQRKGCVHIQGEEILGEARETLTGNLWIHGQVKLRVQLPGGHFQVGTRPRWVSLRPQWLPFASPFEGTQGQTDKHSTCRQLREDWRFAQAGAARQAMRTGGTQPGSTGDLRESATGQVSLANRETQRRVCSPQRRVPRQPAWEEARRALQSEQKLEGRPWVGRGGPGAGVRCGCEVRCEVLHQRGHVSANTWPGSTCHPATHLNQRRPLKMQMPQSCALRPGPRAHRAVIMDNRKAIVLSTATC